VTLLPTRFTSATCAARVKGNAYVLASQTYISNIVLVLFTQTSVRSTDYLYPQLSQTQRTLGST